MSSFLSENSFEPNCTSEFLGLGYKLVHEGVEILAMDMEYMLNTGFELFVVNSSNKYKETTSGDGQYFIKTQMCGCIILFKCLMTVSKICIEEKAYKEMVQDDFCKSCIQNDFYTVWKM